MENGQNTGRSPSRMQSVVISKPVGDATNDMQIQIGVGVTGSRAYEGSSRPKKIGDLYYFLMGFGSTDELGQRHHLDRHGSAAGMYIVAQWRKVGGDELTAEANRQWQAAQ